jgi:hypothetical protein
LALVGLVQRLPIREVLQVHHLHLILLLLVVAGVVVLALRERKFLVELAQQLMEMAVVEKGQMLELVELVAVLDMLEELD